MSAYFDEIGLKGFSNWTKVQAREEVDHGMILFDYLIARNGRVEFNQIDIPETNFNEPMQVFEKIYEHEKSVTAAINSVASMSEDECDLATRNFIDWYIAEQVEEEETVRDIVDMLEKAGKSPEALIFIDHQLGSQKE